MKFFLRFILIVFSGYSQLFALESIENKFKNSSELYTPIAFFRFSKPPIYFSTFLILGGDVASASGIFVDSFCFSSSL